MEEKKRKTETLLGSDKLVHLYKRETPQKIYVMGKVRQYENGEGDKKRYVQEFYGSYQAPKADGEKDDRKRSLFRAETTEPFTDLNEFSGKDVMLMVSGQTYRVESKNKDGNAVQFNKTFVRSIKTTKTEQREVNGEMRDVIVGDKDVMSSDIAAKNEYYAANNRNLHGFINYTKLNQELSDKDGNIFAYRQFMYVGQNKQSTAVEFYTKEPVNPEEFPKGKRISMPGAMHVVNVRDKDGKWTRDEVFEPNYIGAYISNEKEKNTEKDVEPAGMTPEEIMDADSYVPGQEDYDIEEEIGHFNDFTL